MKKHMGLTGFLVAALMLLCTAGIALSADKTVKATGTMTSVETDGTVIIDKGGYELSQSVRILDNTGKKTTFDAYTIPIKVYFEYEYTARGPIIKLIKELAQ